MNAGQMCQRNAITVQAGDEIAAAVVGDYGHLVGVLSLDDVLTSRADELGAAAAVITKGRQIETTIRT
jgi:hypothetical protein